MREDRSGKEGKFSCSERSTGDFSSFFHFWSRKLDFMMACIGYAVGLGNVWRFPYLCYKNGGGAFLIPYMIVSITSGIPLFFLEVSLGQFLGQGCVTCWQICPIFKGIGYGIVVLCNWLDIYYIVVLAWSFYYLFMSFSFELPWSHCNNTWNTAVCSNGLATTRLSCQPVDNNTNVTWTYMNSSMEMLNLSLNDTNCTTEKLVDSVEEFWKHKILQMTSGIHDLGGINWEMTGCLAAAWLLNYFIIWKGVKVSGKIVYFTALFPFVMLLVLFIRGVTLEGASMGIEYYLKPNFSRILEPEVWMDAGSQIFFSYAVSTGALIAMGSYNKFNNHQVYRDSWIICMVNTATGFFAGFSVFAVLGYMAKQKGMRIEDVVADGPGLAFIAYPKAISEMPFAPLWAVLFFFMLVLLGVDSEFVGLEGLFTALLDVYPDLRHGYRPEVTMGVACLLSFIFGLTMSSKGGIYVFQIFDYYSASGFVLLWFCFFECIAIAWVYGAQRFYADIATMIGYKLNNWMLICWSFFAPITSLIIFFVSFVQHKPLTMDDYVFPVWADLLGWGIALSSMIWVPIVFFTTLFRSPGNTLKQKWIFATTPSYLTKGNVLTVEEVTSEIDANPLSSTDLLSPGFPGVL